jgi:phage tail sheath protein FI
MKQLIIIAFICSLISVGATAQDLTFGYKNPSFHSGNGYSNHVLSVEQLRFSREKDIKEKKEQEQKEADRQATQNTVKKFLVNVESRIYAQLSKQLVDNMFGEGSATSGTAEIEGNIVYWEKVDGNINIRITESDGTVTTMSVPVGDFAF